MQLSERPRAVAEGGTSGALQLVRSRPLSRYAGIIATLSSCQWNAFLRFFQEMFHDWDHAVRFRKWGKVAGGGGNGEPGVGGRLFALSGRVQAVKKHSF